MVISILSTSTQNVSTDLGIIKAGQTIQVTLPPEQAQLAAYNLTKLSNAGLIQVTILDDPNLLPAFEASGGGATATEVAFVATQVSGSNAYSMGPGARVNFAPADSSAYMERNALNQLHTPASLVVDGSISSGTSSFAASTTIGTQTFNSHQILDSGSLQIAAQGGANQLILQSGINAGSTTTGAVVLRGTQALGGGDYLVDFQSGTGTSVGHIGGDGRAIFSGYVQSGIAGFVMGGTSVFYPTAGDYNQGMYFQSLSNNSSSSLVAFTLNNSNAMTQGKLISLQNATVEKAYVDYSGALAVGGNARGATWIGAGANTYTDFTLGYNAATVAGVLFATLNGINMRFTAGALGASTAPAINMTYSGGISLTGAGPGNGASPQVIIDSTVAQTTDYPLSIRSHGSEVASFSALGGLVAGVSITSGKVALSVPTLTYVDFSGAAANGTVGVGLRYDSGTSFLTLDGANGLLVTGASGVQVTNALKANAGTFIVNAGTISSSANNIILDATAPGKVYERAPSRFGSYQTITTADTAFTATTLSAPTLLNGTAGAADVTDNAYQMIKYTTSTVSGNAVSISGPFTSTRATYLPMLYAVVRTDPAAVTSTRIYVGMGASSLDQVTTLAGANAIKGCWFRYDTTIGDGTWFCETSDGTTASATDSTIAVAAATTYVLAIDNTVSGTVDFYINGALKVHKTTNINATNTALGIEDSITTLTTAARSLSTSSIVLQQH